MPKQQLASLLAQRYFYEAFARFLGLDAVTDGLGGSRPLRGVRARRAVQRVALRQMSGRAMARTGLR